MPCLQKRPVKRVEIRELLELRNHIDSLMRIYLRKKERLSTRLFEAPMMDDRVTVSELLWCLTIE